MASIGSVWQLVKTAVKDFFADGSPRLAAAVAFYMIFSLAPMLLIAVHVAGVVFGQEAARQELFGRLEAHIGPDAARMIQQAVANAAQSGAGTWALVAGLAALLFGASGVFRQLQWALDKVWDVRPRPRKAIGSFLLKRLLTFAMVLLVGALLILSLVASAVLAGVREYGPQWLPGSALLLQVLSYVVTLGLISVAFAALYKILPDANLAWRDVWVGAVLTAVLFTIGNFLISLYLGRSSLAGAYGAAGSLIIVLLWVYYSTMVFLLGAEFTQVYARQAGRRLEPERHAERLPDARVEPA